MPHSYEDALAHAEPAVLKAPRDSAAVVLLRRARSGEVEVFWARRARSMRFMGGWHAFPGGGLSPEDAATPLRGAARGCDQASRPALTPGWRGDKGSAEFRALAACALRELSEETGLDVADASRLVYAGRWITPPFSSRRYDTHFFSVELRPCEPGPTELSSELEEGEWIRPAAAVQRWRGGEVLLAQPTLHILRVLAENGPDEGRRRLQRPGETDPASLAAIEFRPGVSVVSQRTPTLPPATHTNAFLVGGRDRVLIDPGSAEPEELARLELAIESLVTRRGGKIVEIWLTHHHRDHIGGAAEMRRRLGVPLRAHQTTAEHLTERGIKVDGYLEEGKTAELEGEEEGDPAVRLRVLHTPGHARGHLCFFDEADGALIAGDMLASESTIVIDPPDGHMSDYLASLDKLQSLRPKFLFPSHGAMFADGERRLGALRKHRLWREERVLEAWQTGVREPAEFLASLYDGLEKAAHPLAERQIVAHLDRLRELGKIA